MKKGGAVATIVHSNGTTAPYYVNSSCTSCAPGKPCASHAVTIGTTTKSMCATPVSQTEYVVNKTLNNELHALNSNISIEQDIRTLAQLTERIKKLNQNNNNEMKNATNITLSKLFTTSQKLSLHGAISAIKKN